jgi:hypothetical protein
VLRYLNSYAEVTTLGEFFSSQNSDESSTERDRQEVAGLTDEFSTIRKKLLVFVQYLQGLADSLVAVDNSVPLTSDQVVGQYLNLLHQVQRYCRQQWTQFNLPTMITGILVIVAAWIILFVEAFFGGNELPALANQSARLCYINNSIRLMLARMETLISSEATILLSFLLLTSLSLILVFSNSFIIEEPWIILVSVQIITAASFVLCFRRQISTLKLLVVRGFKGKAELAGLEQSVVALLCKLLWRSVFQLLMVKFLFLSPSKHYQNGALVTVLFGVYCISEMASGHNSYNENAVWVLLRSLLKVYVGELICFLCLCCMICTQYDIEGTDYQGSLPKKLSLWSARVCLMVCTGGLLSEFGGCYHLCCRPSSWQPYREWRGMVDKLTRWISVLLLLVSPVPCWSHVLGNLVLAHNMGLLAEIQCALLLQPSSNLSYQGELSVEVNLIEWRTTYTYKVCQVLVYLHDTVIRSFSSEPVSGKSSAPSERRQKIRPVEETAGHNSALSIVILGQLLMIFNLGRYYYFTTGHRFEFSSLQVSL